MPLTASTTASAAICCTKGRRWPRFESSSTCKGNEKDKQPSGDNHALPPRPTSEITNQSFSAFVHVFI